MQCAGQVCRNTVAGGEAKTSALGFRGPSILCWRLKLQCCQQRRVAADRSVLRGMIARNSASPFFETKIAVLYSLMAQLYEGGIHILHTYSVSKKTEELWGELTRVCRSLNFALKFTLSLLLGYLTSPRVR